LVLQDPDHTVGVNWNPYYQCRLKNSNGIIFERKIVADKTNTDIFKTIAYQNQDLVYTNWNCENIDVSQYIGQSVTLEIIIADCGLGGHFGYVYLDDFCGTKCSAPTFGNITLNPINLTCPLLPLTVAGSFIAPAGYELQSLKLEIQDNSLSPPSVVKTIASGYILTGTNTFYFKVKNSDLFPLGAVSNKGFDFFVTGTFKLIGGTSTNTFTSQSANTGNDVTFNTTCHICDDCNTTPTY
jgi:hypothetical protein